MQLFHWHSEALKDYRYGVILVLAPDVESARQQVRDHARGWLIQDRPWFFTADGAVDENELEEHDAWVALLEKDLAETPSNEPVWLIKGGE